ncbi:PREDICTED: putative syntaxin-4 [Amphimedon queenslandica]|nr:PREDICTED: putative syntaxin-4 [Amphimedon queenslandica]|eukprot:XP_003389800.1 PREDICTED: putative syntaxin-4 [Amphimedon queenslandica]
MEGEGSVQESQADSFTSDPTVNNDGDTLAQEALQVDQSGLNIREQQATEIRELEKDIGDLHDISKHINVMIVDQGSQIDRIELHTEKAAHRTEKGTANTTTAVVLKRQNNTLLIALLVAGGGVLLFIIIVIIILAVVLTRND